MNRDPLQTLERVAQEKHHKVTAWLASLKPYDRRGLFIEVCRALDYEQVRQMSDEPEHRLPYQEFDLMLRGWNATLVAMLTPDFNEEGLPARPSTHDTLRVGRTILHEMGLVSLLRKTASMVRHAMTEVTWEGDILSIRSLNFATSDHFLDQIDIGALPRLTPLGGSLLEMRLKSLEDIREEMKNLVFPWTGVPGVTMVGYGAEPDIDAYFLGATADQMLDWRNEAGIYPGTEVRGCNGALLATIAGLLASIYLKHIHFIGIGYRELKDVNFPMSLTIWEPRADLIESLTRFIGGNVTASAVAMALDFLIVDPSNTRFFGATERPYIPLLIQVSNLHVLRPIASIFRNPLHGARLAFEFDDPNSEATFREPREAWMRSELNLLFLETRCELMWKPCVIKHRGQTLTDIDAAVYEPESHCLALFQLKWQDFGAAEVKKQRSRAKNFVSQVDDWTSKIEEWTAEVGLDGVAKAIHLEASVATILLFAVGRFVARFKSYGYGHVSSSVAVCSWPQLVRIRKEMTVEKDILRSLYDRVVEERSRIVSVTPLPYEVLVEDTQMVFQNIWNAFDDGSKDE